MRHKIALFAWLIYLSFIGGSSYVDRNIFIQFLQHGLMFLLLGGYVWGLLRRGEPWTRTAIDGPALLYALWLLVLVFISGDSRVSLEQSLLWGWHIFLLYWLVAWFRGERGRWLMEALFLMAALVVVVSFVELLAWYFGLGFGAGGPGWWGLDGPWPPYWHRVGLAMNVSTWLGAYIVLVLPMVIAWALTAQKRDDRQTLALLAGGLALTLLLTQSRGGLLGLAAAGGMAVFLGQLLPQVRGGAWGGWGWRGLQAAAAGLAILALLGLGAYLSRGRAQGDQGRVLLWRSAVEMIADQPLTGVGVYQYGARLRDYATLDVSSDHLKTAHNLYLNTLAEIGLIGGGILLWGVWLFGRAWWAAWQGASPAQRTRLTAALAALAGLAAQSLVDTFTYTATLLPAFIAMAYILAQVPPSPPRQHWQVAAPYALRYVIALALLGLGGWLVLINMAQFRAFQAQLALVRDEPAEALERIQQAQELDPGLRFYDLQAAYILGRLAEDDPGRYLGPALQAHEAALAADPDFYQGQVNWAALQAQNGDYPAAIERIRAAQALRPDLPQLSLLLGQYLEAGGDMNGAQAAYEAGLPASAMWSGSAFWTSSPPRQAAFQARYAALDPSSQLFWAVDQNLGVDALLPSVEALAEGGDYLALKALGYYWLHLGGDSGRAAAYFEQSLAILDFQAWTEAQLAAAYWDMGEGEAAEKAAKRALFLDGALGPFAQLGNFNYTRGLGAYEVLARMAIAEESASDEQINQWLIQAVIQLPLLQSYEDVVFSRLGYLDELPQVLVPGMGERAYGPWLLLAERFGADEDFETDPADVYRAMLREDPFMRIEADLMGE